MIEPRNSCCTMIMVLMTVYQNSSDFSAEFAYGNKVSDGKLDKTTAGNR